MPRPSAASRQSRRKWLKIDDFEFVCFNFAKEYLNFDEPIPGYETRDNSLLESALGSPQQTYGGKLLYPTLTKQAAILFYSLIKNHPFRNGNKRIAVISLLTFLALNGKWVSIDELKLYILAKDTAQTKPADSEETIRIIEREIGTHLKNYPMRKN